MQGQLGQGDYEPRLQPTVVRALEGKNVVALSAGQDASFAVIGMSK